MVRVFFAVEPSKEIRTAISEAGKILQSSSARLTVVDPDLMHVTLKFLGEVSETKLAKIISAAECLEGASYEMRARKVSSFGRPPRVVKAEVFDFEKTAMLAKTLDELLVPLGFLRDEKKFSPHITIARVKSYSPDLLELVSKVSECEFGSCQINSVQLKKSTLTPSGPKYETVFEKSLCV